MTEAPRATVHLYEPAAGTTIVVSNTSGILVPFHVFVLNDFFNRSTAPAGPVPVITECRAGLIVLSAASK